MFLYGNLPVLGFTFIFYILVLQLSNGKQQAAAMKPAVKADLEKLIKKTKIIYNARTNMVVSVASLPKNFTQIVSFT